MFLCDLLKQFHMFMCPRPGQVVYGTLYLIFPVKELVQCLAAHFCEAYFVWCSVFQCNKVECNLVQNIAVYCTSVPREAVHQG